MKCQQVVSQSSHGMSLILQPFVASPTSQLILQPFRRFTNVTARSTTVPLLHLRHRHFTYVIDTSPTSQLILQLFRRFIYVTSHSTTLPVLHLRHSSFFNPSAALPTSIVILQPFTYVTGTSRTSVCEPRMYRGMKKQCVVD